MSALPASVVLPAGYCCCRPSVHVEHDVQPVVVANQHVGCIDIAKNCSRAQPSPTQSSSAYLLITRV